MQQTSNAKINLLNFTIPIKIKALYAMQIIMFLFFSFDVSNTNKHMNATWSLMKRNHMDFNCNLKVTFQIQQSIYAYQP